MFHVVYLYHVFLKSSTVICYNINKLTYLLYASEEVAVASGYA